MACIDSDLQGQQDVYEFSLVYDSADELEQYSKNLLLDIYNSDGKNATFDTRSDNKGEPQYGDLLFHFGALGHHNPAHLCDKKRFLHSQLQECTHCACCIAEPLVACCTLISCLAGRS